jgi:hypothetical protein
MKTGNKKLTERESELLEMLKYADSKLSEVLGTIEYNLGSHSHISIGIKSTIQKYEQSEEWSKEEIAEHNKLIKEALADESISMEEAKKIMEKW